jgi:peptidoglycan/LPS O-acetylase OafA/YrhL
MRLTFQSTVARSSQYRADIDGLRAVAVLSVLFFHTKIPGFPGGFVGVDVFFVISGYLITSIIAKDMFQEKFSFLAFYERRMRRIFPAIFFLLFSCTLIAAVLLAPSDFVVFARTMIAATGFLSNFYFLRHAAAGGYFANLSDLQPLLHTWSLAVEEQFYLLFPAVLFALIKWARQRTRQWLSVFALVSFLLSVKLMRHHPSAAFYMLLPRSWELLMGSLLALKAVPPISPRWLREIASTAGLVLIICADFFYTNQTPFPGLSALLPCVGAWLVIYAGEQGSPWANTALTFPPLVFIGVISYSLYLWHWPLIVFANYFSGHNLRGAQTLAVILISILMAFISFEFVESRFRGRNAAFSRRQIFALGLSASGAALLLGVFVVRSSGLPQRYDAVTRNLVIENAVRRHDFQEVCSNFRTNPHSLADINFCILGPGADRKILFWGDSHVQQLYPIVKNLYDSGALEGRGAVFAIANSCMPVEHMNDPRKGFHCDTFSTLAKSRAEMNDIDTVFIGFNTWWSYNKNGICPSVNGKCIPDAPSSEIRGMFLAGLADDIHEFRASGKNVIICLPFPDYDKSIPDLEIRNAVFARFGMVGAAVDQTLPNLRVQIADLARSFGASIFDPRKSLCRDGPCTYQIGGVSIYIDNNHIAASQIGILEDNLRQVLQNEPIPRPNRRGFQLAERANQRSLPEGSWPRKQKAN